MQLGGKRRPANPWKSLTTGNRIAKSREKVITFPKPKSRVRLVNELNAAGKKRDIGRAIFGQTRMRAEGSQRETAYAIHKKNVGSKMSGEKG